MYIYLGKQVSYYRNRSLKEITRRINITWQKYWAHREIMKKDMHPPLSNVWLTNLGIYETGQRNNKNIPSYYGNTTH